MARCEEARSMGEAAREAAHEEARGAAREADLLGGARDGVVSVC